MIRSGQWDYGLLVDEVIGMRGMRHFGPQHRQTTLDEVEAGLRPYVTEALLNDGQYWLAFDTGKLLADVESKLDKAAKRNIIPTGRANRLKGRLKRTVAKAGKPAA